MSNAVVSLTLVTPLPLIAVITPPEQIIATLSVGQGPSGPAGASAGSSIQKTAAVALSGHRVVLLNSSGQVSYATNLVLANASRVLGVTNGAVSAGALATVVRQGEMVEPSWAWTLDEHIYLGAGGVLTQTAPASPAKFLLVVGFPISATSMFVQIGNPIQFA